MARSRAHPSITIPPAVAGVIDRITGRRRVRLSRAANVDADRALLERQRVVLARTAGILKDVDIPGWETPESTSAWVEALREEDSRATDEKLSSHPAP
jgi:hypothetical protein